MLHIARRCASTIRSMDAIRADLVQYGGGVVRLTLDDRTGIGHLVLDHTAAKNAMTGTPQQTISHTPGTMMAELGDHVTTLERWTAGRCVTLSGAAHTFCAGGQLEFVAQTATSDKGGDMCAFMQVALFAFYRLYSA